MALVNISVDLAGLGDFEQVWPDNAPHGGEVYNEDTGQYEYVKPKGIKVVVSDLEALEGWINELTEAQKLLKNIHGLEGVELESSPKSEDDATATGAALSPPARPRRRRTTTAARARRR